MTAPRSIAKFESWHRKWCYIGGRGGSVLHRVVFGRWDDNYWRFNDAEAECGQVGPFYIPGILSRMGLPRCKRCCRKTDVPYGAGAPFNDKHLNAEERAR